MTSKQIRNTFLDFFKSKNHEIVPSAPMVIKNDPTLMFTNAGMNQFKDIFLGNSPSKFHRVADTQKCLRVSGKHNDLEEVGIDTYHHTMFEMLGNWSFGDYFKKEAIAWAWELLTKVYKLPQDRLYVTVFEGDEKEKLGFDKEASEEWKKWISADRILNGNKKDNFWEMGETGPCGPCSEIHIDLRNESERKKTDGKTLVNGGHPQVVEIWNNVFMEFNRKADASLETLPAKHVDTGMGFERLCMAIQGKTSNYDTDVFQPLIQFISVKAKVNYGSMEKTDIAMRVLADHIRAIAFAISDGQLPSNNKAGYVIRRILRRAVRYGYTFLNFKEPFLYTMLPILAEQFGEIFPELASQQDFIAKVIQEEEKAFLKTLSSGIIRFEEELPKTKQNKNQQNKLSGDFAFELYDTFGFPIDLTELLSRERGMTVDMEGFGKKMNEQKTRSRAASEVDTGDWIFVHDGEETESVAYESMACEVEILKYRKVKTKTKEQYQLVFNRTPFYAESGGQVGDSGYLESGSEKISVTDTRKENNLIVHVTDKLPSKPDETFQAKVNSQKRKLITSNHSATHLMHAALRKVLGKHVAQKGSLVNEDVTRFDFSHFAKVSEEELAVIETLVNEKIRENILLDEKRNVPIKEATAFGAMALFGEKYGDFVRVITFDKNYSVELCGGTHVKSTGEIGLFKIISESSVAAGVRRVEAITNQKAVDYLAQKMTMLEQISITLNNPKDPVKAIQQILNENSELKKVIENLLTEKAAHVKKELLSKILVVNGINFLSEKINLPSAETIKNLSFELNREVENLFLLLGAEVDGKAFLSLILSENLVTDRQLDATKIIRDLSKEIQGGGGGQNFYATAGGKNTSGLASALLKAKEYMTIFTDTK